MPIRQLLPLLPVLLFLFTTTRAGILEDRDIEDAVQSSFVFRELIADRTMLRIFVRNGAVEVRGQVADERERHLVGDLVTALPDVRSVDNRLFVDSAYRRTSDRWLAARLRALLLMPSAVEAGVIEAQVNSGNILLSGQVRTEDQKRLAENLVRELVPGRNIDNQLEIVPELPLERRVLDDASVVALAWSSLHSIPERPRGRLIIRSDSGHVTVEGQVDDKDSLAEIDRRISGLRGVRSHVNHATVSDLAGPG